MEQRAKCHSRVRTKYGRNNRDYAMNSLLSYAEFGENIAYYRIGYRATVKL
jgi:hypothetical protein